MTAPHGWALEDRRGRVRAVEATEPPPAPGTAAARRRGMATRATGAAAPDAASESPAKPRATSARRARARRESTTAPLPFDEDPGDKWGGAAPPASPPTTAVEDPATPPVPVAVPVAVAVADAAATGTAVPGTPHEGADCVEAWSPRFDRDDDLDGLLDAKTPLLSRAFRNIRAV